MSWCSIGRTSVDNKQGGYEVFHFANGVSKIYTTVRLHLIRSSKCPLFLVRQYVDHGCGILELAITVLTLVLGSWLGAFFGNRYSVKLAEQQKVEHAVATTQVCLQYLREQMKYNLELLRKLESFLDGPVIRYLWSPAGVLASHLQLDAWGTLVQSGVLSFLTSDQRAQLASVVCLTR